MKDKFQANFDIVRLYGENNSPPPVTKIGVLPFIVESTQPGAAEPSYIIKILVMKPCAEAKHLGEPGFQLAKGTRRININGGWCDMREDDLRNADESFWEPLAATALREGEEEIGLKPSNITKLFDMGAFTFISASKGIKKPLHMFAAQMLSPDDFGRYESSTMETRWMTPEEFAGKGREDHVTIVNEIVRVLTAAL